MNWMRFLTLLLIWANLAGLAAGHQVETVEFEFQKLKTQWRLVGQMDIAYMLPETRKLAGSQPLSRQAVMKASPEELARIRRETENTLRKLLRLTFAGEEIHWKIEFPDFDKEPFKLPEELADWALLTVRIVVDARSEAGDLKVHWSKDDEAELIILTEDSENGEIVSVRPGGELVLVRVAAPDGAVASVNNAPKAPEEAEHSPFLSWIHSGFRHVLPLGLDHMLFIFGLFLMVLKLRPLMWQSLLFTLSHSITLALSVLGWIHLDRQLVEVLIAFSIAFIGVENLLAKKVGKLRYMLVFGFGLIHGMGFASVMSDKVRNVPRDQLTMPLLGFNIGVELAQITVLVVAFMLFVPLRNYTRPAQMMGSAIVASAGTGWMIERIFFA